MLIICCCDHVLLSAVCLRIQINPQNKGDFLTVSPERAFADFLFAHTVLHLVIVNFVGWMRPSVPFRLFQVSAGCTPIWLHNYCMQYFRISSVFLWHVLYCLAQFVKSVCNLSILIVLVKILKKTFSASWAIKYNKCSLPW